MAMDAIYLELLREQLNQILPGSRVDKIHQLSKEELMISFRGKGQNLKLYLSARANSARVHLTKHKMENPQTPPMFCMLLRKHLNNAKLVEIRQPQNERILFFDFDSVDELGDVARVVLVCEIMGRHSNLILMKEGKILDGVKRVDFSMSSVRQVLPNLPYTLPPQRDQINLLGDAKEIVQRISLEQGILTKVLLKVVGGISPLIARELVFLTIRRDCEICELSSEEMKNLEQGIDSFGKGVKNGGIPTILYKENGDFFDYSYGDILQYEEHYPKKQMENLSELLDYFYYEKDNLERLKQRSGNLMKTIQNAMVRIEKKQVLQKKELDLCSEREGLKQKGDLLQMHLQELEKGMDFIEVEDYYSPSSGSRLHISLRPHFTPVENLQWYYQKYKKTYTAEKMLNEQIEVGEKELAYLDTVLDAMMRVEGDTEILEIQEELVQTGYLKKSKQKEKKKKQSAPIRYRSTDGFVIYAGKNNLQNDFLTTKKAKKEDIWFHTQKIPGSHVVVITEGNPLPDNTYTQAAMIAAYHSKGAKSAQIPVDYTEVKHVKKLPNAKPGMVIYHVYHTAYVTPEEQLIQSLLEP